MRLASTCKFTVQMKRSNNNEEYSLISKANTLRNQHKQMNFSSEGKQQTQMNTRETEKKAIPSKHNRCFVCVLMFDCGPHVFVYITMYCDSMLFCTVKHKPSTVQYIQHTSKENVYIFSWNELKKWRANTIKRRDEKKRIYTHELTHNPNEKDHKILSYISVEREHFNPNESNLISLLSLCCAFFSLHLSTSIYLFID